MEEKNISRISPEKAMELLLNDGIAVDIEQTKIILEFLYEMSEIVVTTYLSNQKNVNLPTKS